MHAQPYARPALIALALTAMLTVALDAAGARMDQPLSPVLPEATDATPEIGLVAQSALDASPPQRKATRRRHHPLQMPFFSFQPLG